LPLLAWAALLGVFLFDATVTLLRRAARGDRWTTPHRLHAYQRLVQSGLSHALVAGGTIFYTTLAAAALRFVWTVPWGVTVIFIALPTLLLALYLIAERRLSMGRAADHEELRGPQADLASLTERR
jgi:Fuc2NAc and GlcNAc transferase